ncbi:GTP-binding protein [Roseomonas sp. HF4]|uniref:GTP-binding protein n=1 Tax=Roseomonas sp. HF4 TaxID=2562313 RepID=UPI0010BFCD91|nr:GTP-binding protein [Roseomonas sp. HF4]
MLSISARAASSVSAPPSAALGASLDATAPGTKRIETRRAEAPRAVLLGLARGRFRSAADEVATTDHRALYRSWTIARSTPLSSAAFDRLAARLSRGAIRAKGFVQMAEAPDIRRLYQQVGTRWALSREGAWPERSGRTRIVAIGLAAEHAAAGTGRAAPAAETFGTVAGETA